MDVFYQCSMCQAGYPCGPELMLCPKCAAGQQQGEPLRGVLDVHYSSEAEDWTYAGVDAKFFPPLPVGQTGLWPVPGLRKHLGFSHLFVKNEGQNPTGSLKDRASFLVAAFARSHGIEEIVLASTGNAGSSMAGVGAAAGIGVRLFLPASAPKAKMIQALQYGAKLILVDGNYDLAFQLAQQWTQERGGYSRNTGYNPLTIEGKKTVSLEIFAQLGRIPDHVFVPTGDGVILSGVYKGFRDLVTQKKAARIPTIWAVQAEGSNALCRAFATGAFNARPAQTVADSISVDVPCNGYHALANLKQFGGEVATVGDESILSAQHLLSAKAGLFTEPAGATALAGFLAVAEALNPQDTVVLLATGHGLKDPQSAARTVHMPQSAITAIDQLE